MLMYLQVVQMYRNGTPRLGLTFPRTPQRPYLACANPTFALAVSAKEPVRVLSHICILDVYRRTLIFIGYDYQLTPSRCHRMYNM
jgi:hypothetical protein